MTTSQTIGEATGGKPINLAQLSTELASAGVDVSASGLGLHADLVYTYDAEGQPADFAASEQHAVEQAIADHVAMRDKTSAEYAAEFQDPNTPPARKQEIRDIQSGLMPPEQVPM
jgi:hypothetical protein